MNYGQLLSSVSRVHRAAQRTALGAVNKLHVLRNWTVGYLIVEFEQNGEDRAAYGEQVLKNLRQDLDAAGMTGLGLSTLKGCRTFYRLYPQIGPPAVDHFSAMIAEFEKSQTLIGQLPVAIETRSSSARRPLPLPAEKVLDLSWSHLLELIRLDDPWKRAFYENECLKGGWSVRQLQRQIASLLYDRTAFSTDKETVINHARRQASEAPQVIADLIRDPYILEFTGLTEKSHYLERDLETLLLDHLQSFLLELGTGFCFEARQKRVTIGNEHDFIDLVFYHRILRCHLLIDLKVRTFQHGDAGQMNFYLNFWKDQVMQPGDQPPVGLILCADKRQPRVDYATAGLDHQLFVSRYLNKLPSIETLQNLIERDTATWLQIREEAAEYNAIPT